MRLRRFRNEIAAARDNPSILPVADDQRLRSDVRCVTILRAALRVSAAISRSSCRTPASRV